ncbi:hypothetical protein AVEN_192659-1 [Araneus ventricosus]|uniref:Uncharacterized protein n=1 Tax=Araneus ventricosus TaxID=182803 RepID=A0A4Y2U7F1_ARAVE|nr:hypothetical protein AVEN_192659-1 [Araneus ventricosus]
MTNRYLPIKVSPKIHRKSKDFMMELKVLNPLVDRKEYCRLWLVLPCSTRSAPAQKPGDGFIDRLIPQVIEKTKVLLADSIPPEQACHEFYRL